LGSADSGLGRYAGTASYQAEPMEGIGSAFIVFCYRILHVVAMSLSRRRGCWIYQGSIFPFGVLSTRMVYLQAHFPLARLLCLFWVGHWVLHLG
jgi:hypothetical protein